MGKLITQSEAAKLRGVTVAAINYLVKKGRIRGVEKYGRTLVYDNEVINYKPRQAGRPTTKATSKKKSAKK
jgi:fatty acid-binding protein DegV